MFKPGYIVTNNYDTLRGYVKYAETFPFQIFYDVRFKDSVYGKPRKYSPEQIQGFKSIDYDFFAMQEPEFNEFYFMQRMVDGYAKLYVHFENAFISSIPFSSISFGSNSTESYYIIRPNEEKLTMIYQTGFKRFATDYFKDNPELVKKIQAGKNYRYRDLKRIVEEYNRSVN